MKDKIELLKKAFGLVSKDKGYMAYFLIEYAKLEKQSVEMLNVELKCSEESIYTLGLCKAPILYDANSLKQLKDLADFTRIDLYDIRQIVNRVTTMQKFQNQNDGNIIMAARDKTSKS